MAYVLDPAMSVTHEVRRAALERLDVALAVLDQVAQGADDIEAAVHDVRKRCKEFRALARLVRSSLEDEFDRINRLVGDAADALAGFRDAHAVLGTFDDLRAAGAHDPELDAVRAALAVQAQTATRDLHAGDPRIGRAHELLTEARRIVDGWHADDSFATLRTGIDTTYRHGRRDLRRARKRPTDHRLHEWRKSVKHLWYQTRLVQRAAPSALQPFVASLDDLAEALGDDHDLAVLVEQLEADPERFGGMSKVERAVRLARSQQDSLRHRAFRLGATVYAERGGAFSRRVEVYWRRARQLGPELETGGIAELASDEQVPATASESPSGGTVERERKFLVTDPPELPQQGTTLRQGYLAIDRSVAVRVRDAGHGGCTLTVKAGHGAVRMELEWPISEEQFAAAWEQTGERRVHKTRYRLPLDGDVIELDVFHDELAPLVLAEVEFDSDEALAAFEPPPWFGGEVTDDVSYTNAALAVNGLPPDPR